MKRLLSVLLLALALALSFGCSDDDDNPVNGGQTAECNDDTSPNNAYKVKETDEIIVVDDPGSFPEEYIDLLEDALAQLFANTEDTQWNVTQSAVALTRAETPMCVPVPYVYIPLTRSCTVPVPLDLDEDVSSLGLCAPFPNPINSALPDIEVCLTDISITATIDPDLVWSEDFSTFSGTEAIGSADVPADVTVSLTVAGLPAGPFSFAFHMSRTVNGTCCATCNPCP